MRIGMFGINAGPMATDPDLLAEVAVAAEQLGYDSVWTGEHMCVPSPRVPPSPMEPTDPILDPMAALSFLAARTERLLLGTGILLLPQRNPVALAKEVASLDVLSRGRLLLGVGVGYLAPEFAAVGVPMERRGERTLDYLAAMQALWQMETPAYDGEFTSFHGIDAHPRPVRREGPPIVMAGHSAPAFRRAVQVADEWYGFRCDPDRTAWCLNGLQRAEEAHGLGRAATAGRLLISITPAEPLDRELADRYAALGVDRLIVLAPAGDRDGVLRALERQAPAALGLG